MASLSKPELMELVFSTARMEMWYRPEWDTMDIRYVDNEGRISWRRFKSERLDNSSCEADRKAHKKHD